MIKYLSVFFLLFGLSLTQSFGQVAVRVGEKAVNTGDEFELPVYVEASVTGKNLLSYQFAFTYSSSLSAISVSNASTLTSSWGAPTAHIDPTSRTIQVAGAGGTALTGTGNLFFIKFKALSATSSAFVSFTPASSFFNEGNPTATFTNGKASITNVPTLSVSPASGLLLKGETLKFTASGGTAPYTYSSSNTTVGTVDATGLFTAKAVGFAKVSAEDSKGIKGAITNEVEVRGFRLIMRDTTMFVGKKLLFPIKTTSLAGLGIVSGDIVINHGASGFKVLGLQKSGTLLENAEVTYSSEGGTTRISFARSAGITGTGLLLQLEVEGVSSTVSTFSFNEITFNESLAGLGTSGTLRVNALPNLSVSAGKSQLMMGEKLQYSVSGGTAPYTWSVSNPALAEVSATGLLTAKRGGTLRVQAQDANGATGESSVLSIYDSEVAIATDQAPVRTTYDLPVRIDALPAGSNVSAIELTFSFRKPELVFKSIVQTDALTAGWSVTENALDEDTYKIALASATSFTKPGVLFYLRFELTNDLTVGETAAVTLDQILLNEGDPVVLAKSGSIQGITCAPPTPPTVTGASNCGPGSVVLTAAGGTAGNYRWYTSATGGTPIASATNATYTTPTISSTTTYYVSVLTASDCESARTAVIATINALPAAPTVTAAVSYCQNETAVALTATGSALKWYTTATGGTGSATAPTPATSAAGATEYFVTQTVNGCESTRAKITVTVKALPTAPTVTAQVAYCVGATATALTATGSSLKWYTTATGGTATSTAPTPLTTTVGATNYYVSQTTNGCEGPRAQITVTVNALPTAPGVTGDSRCGSGSVSLTATGGTAGNYRWYTSATGGSPIASATGATYATPSISATTTYYVSVINANGCESGRTAVTATINAVPAAPGVTATVSYCAGATASALTATGSNLKWYTTATGGTGSSTAITPSTATAGVTEYYVSQTSASGCESVRAKITVTVNALPTAPTVTPAATCGPAAMTLAAAGGSAGNYRWYPVATGGTAIASATAATYTTPVLSATTTYYVSVVNASGCESARTAVTATVNAIPPKPTFTAAMNASNQNVLTSSSPSGNQWLRDGAVIAGATGTTHIVTQPGSYAVRVTVNGCENTSDARIQLITGVKEDSELSRSLVLYPNPARERILLSFTTTGTVAKKAQLTVYNYLGQTLEVKTVTRGTNGWETTFDTQHYPKGSYFIIIDTGEFKTRRAFVVQ